MLDSYAGRDRRADVRGCQCDQHGERVHSLSGHFRSNERQEDTIAY